MKPFKDLSISSKLVFLILSVSLTIVILIAGVRLAWDLQQGRQALQRELSTLTHLLGDRSSAALAFDDTRMGTENLNSLVSIPHVVEACLFHSNGTVLAEYRRANVAAITACSPAGQLPDMGARFESDRLIITAEIRKNEHLLGWIYVTSDLSELETQLSNQVAFSVLTLLATILVGGLLAGWVQRFVAGPVVAVTAAARDIERDGNYNRRAPVTSHDEVGELAQSFNAMLDSLQANTEELAAARTEQVSLLTRYRNLFDHANDVILLADVKSGDILDINPQACTRYGYTREEFLKMNLQDLSASTASDVLTKITVNQQKKGEAVFESLHRSKNGQTIPMEVSSCVIELDGRPVFLSILRDLTERKQAQQLIALSETKFRSLFETASDAILLLRDSHFIDCNPQALSMFDCKREDMLSNTSSAFSPTTQYDGRDSTAAMEEKINAALAGEPQFFPWHYRKPDGSLFDAEVSLNRIELDGELYLQEIIRDITNRRRAEAELITAKEQAEEASQAKTEFLARMSHELRTPLNAILGFAQVMELDDDNVTLGAYRSSIETITRSGWHLLRIIDDLLNLSAIEANTVVINYENIDVCNCVHACITLLSPLARESGIELIYIDENCNCLIVRADRFRLDQVLINLLSNAIKYNRAGGSVTVSCQHTPGRIRILVSDTGEGIPKSELASLFQPFSRLVQRAYTVEGAGIGLSIAKQLTNLMGGTIGVESECGKGSTFWFELSAVEAPEAVLALSNAHNSHLNEVKTVIQMTLLYIEDNPDHINLVGNIVARMANLSLLTAHTPNLGLDVARSRRPDLILLDIDLPGMTGYQILKLLQSDRRTSPIPVMAISAAAHPIEIEKGLQAGFTRYFTKPLNVVDFRNMIVEVLSCGNVSQESSVK